MRFYYTKTSTRVGFALLAVLYTTTFVWSVFLCDFSNTAETIRTLIWLVFPIGWTLVFFLGQHSFSFYINNKGVQFKKRSQIFSIEWKDIKRVVLVGYKPTSSIKNSKICFESITANSDFSYYDASDYGKYDNDFFAVTYKKKIIKEIKKYWDKPIENLYQVDDKK